MKIEIALGFLIFASVTFLGSAADEDLEATFARLKADLKPLDLGSTEPPSGTAAYLKFYSLAFNDVDHSIGTIRSGTNKLAVQVFKPRETKGTVVLSHGYYDHAGVLKHLIRHLVEAGFAVAVIDHAGHGLSTGSPAAIGDFKEYVDGLNQLLGICSEQLPGPLQLMGHSMGCAVVLDSLLTGKELPVDRIVLLAPLVRSSAWKTSGLALKLGGSKLNSVPRKFRQNSSDKSFLTFHQLDPLQAQTVPICWVMAHRKWYQQLPTTGTCARKVTIIQGTKDSTVDWKHNLKYLQQRIPNATVVMIKGGGHQLANEALNIRREVLEKVLKP